MVNSQPAWRSKLCMQWKSEEMAGKWTRNSTVLFKYHNIHARSRGELIQVSAWAQTQLFKRMKSKITEEPPIREEPTARPIAIIQRHRGGSKRRPSKRTTWLWNLISRKTYIYIYIFIYAQVSTVLQWMPFLVSLLKLLRFPLNSLKEFHNSGITISNSKDGRPWVLTNNLTAAPSRFSTDSCLCADRTVNPFAEDSVPSSSVTLPAVMF